MEKIIVTAALPYSYSIPHLGNFVGSVLPADVYYKYLRMKGADAIFICGSDQHGTSGELKAMKEGKDPEELSNEMHAKLKKLFDSYECSFTFYGKTHTPENRDTVYEFFNSLNKNGYIGETESEMPYCNVDNMILADSFIEGTCPFCSYTKAKGNQCENCGRLLDPAQLVEPRCTICHKYDITFKKVKNLALLLDKLQDEIERFIKERSKNHWSKSAKNKALSYIKEGLKPRDITRKTRWGFPVPLKGFEDTKLYVWFDAPIGYIGITKEWDNNRWREYWLGKDTKLIQFMGKDNIEFHALVWPGMLIGSALGFPLPYTIKASEYLLDHGLKFSKSSATGLDMQAALGILEPDYWRFALISLYPETADTEFSTETMFSIVNGVMNDNIGNFVNRALSMAKRDAPRRQLRIAIEDGYGKEAENIIKEYISNFESLNLREAMRCVVALSTLGNSIIGNKQPWLLSKKAGSDADAAEELNRVLGTVVCLVYKVGILIWPFAPGASGKILSYFKVNSEPRMDMLDLEPKLDTSKEVKPIFTKLPESFAEHITKG